MNAFQLAAARKTPCKVLEIAKIREETFKQMKHGDRITCDPSLTSNIQAALSGWIKSNYVRGYSVSTRRYIDGKGSVWFYEGEKK